MRRIALSLSVMFGLFLTSHSPVFAQDATPCQFILGFATLEAMIPTQVGQCLNDQTFAGNGDATQNTTGGVLVWRKADNWTAFTDGYHTWINGPYGLAERLNTQRYSWEANPNNLPTVDTQAAVPTETGVVATPANLIAHTFYASTYHEGTGTQQAHTIYCDDDPAWKKLSANYLVQFPNYATAAASLPSFYVLHQPC